MEGPEDPEDPDPERQVMPAPGPVYPQEEDKNEKGLRWRPSLEFLSRGAQSSPDGNRSDGEASALSGPGEDDEDYDSDLKNWEMEEGEGAGSPATGQRAGSPVKEDWDAELNPYDAEDIHCTSSPEKNRWVPRAPVGDLIYDPSWHHPAPLTPHYTKMVFETGQFDDAED
ncbi:coordinator of PRMT5 and differentiation stimulator [Tachyglossus aculeatus]|uniref:coordinator of PRMT5 and differentiation stimulator n=1 Tax=Tachyglossus aculeatus TaxID=9261 RepID=UPI0018F70D17|nr:coordinator of PRMT5 and differentiation stimulator [Tachyglossus aculeatus]